MVFYLTMLGVNNIVAILKLLIALHFTLLPISSKTIEQFAFCSHEHEVLSELLGSINDQWANFNQTSQECFLGNLLQKHYKKFDPLSNKAARRHGSAW